MRVHEPKARAYYLKEAEEQGWDTRELERQIRTFAYERVVANQIEPDGTADNERHELTPETLLKDPCVAEFLNLRENLRGKEKKVERRIIDHIEKFMLELGKGFALVGRQFRIPVDGVNKFLRFALRSSRAKTPISSRNDAFVPVFGQNPWGMSLRIYLRIYHCPLCPHCPL